MNGFEKRAAAKQRQILEAAFQLMNTESGVDNLTMDKVAQLAHVSKATVFKYFQSKENLIQAVFKDFLETMKQESMAIINAQLPFEETIMATSRYELDKFETTQRRFFIDLMDTLTAEGPQGQTLIHEEYTQQSLQVMLELFHRGRKEGKVDLKYSDEFLLLYFQALVEGLSSPLIYSRILPYTAEWVEVLLKGIAPAPK
ncbi:TetR family transcriptional regulator [Enterococcus canis]|uniref:TetR family transcriptional regulator n=1 Tax=Enterococcus canis TaxID=214095 RepID=A0A1L8REF4_9ENTE|nr:TetR/AcrR family transcriptional regulator [Enterococcus canis]OJG18138.1 TetR family transcriptional regulator [Enterococcus canis]